MLKIAVPTSQDFDYQATVDSHGWRSLAPFQYDRETKHLSRIQQLSNREMVRLDFVDGGSAGLSVAVIGVDSLSPDEECEIKGVVSRCFSVSWDLRAFLYCNTRTQGIRFY